MNLRDIAGNAFPELEDQLDGSVGALAVSGISSDSRRIEPGMVFVAVAGTKADGAGFVATMPQDVAPSLAVASHSIDASIPVLVVKRPAPFPVVAASRFYKRSRNDGCR